MDFLRFENRTIIKAELKMLTPLSIGGGTSLIPAGSDQPVVKTPDGKPFIPGSTLKGIIRSHTEQILRTLDALGKKINSERLWACNPFGEKGKCVIANCCERCEECESNCCENCNRCKACMIKRSQINGTLDDEIFTKKLWQASCTACRLFGSQWLASRVYFKDAFLNNENNLLHLTEIRDGIGIDRDLGTVKEHLKYDYEVVPAGASFNIEIIIENAENWEIGLILLSIKSMEKGMLPIGGKKTRGLGWNKIEKLSIESIKRENLIDYLTNGTFVTLVEDDLIRSFTSSLR